MVKGRLESQTHFPCCLLRPPSHPSVGVHCLSLSLFLSLALSDSRHFILSVHGFQEWDWSGGWRQDAQKVVKKLGPLCLRIAMYLQSKPQDWLLPDRTQVPGSFPGLLPHHLFSPLPRKQGPGTHALTVLSFSLSLSYEGFSPETLRLVVWGIA